MRFLGLFVGHYLCDRMEGDQSSLKWLRSRLPVQDNVATPSRPINAAERADPRGLYISCTLCSSQVQAQDSVFLDTGPNEYLVHCVRRGSNSGKTKVQDGHYGLQTTRACTVGEQPQGRVYFDNVYRKAFKLGRQTPAVPRHDES